MSTFSPIIHMQRDRQSGRESDTFASTKAFIIKYDKILEMSMKIQNIKRVNEWNETLSMHGWVLGMLPISYLRIRCSAGGGGANCSNYTCSVSMWHLIINYMFVRYIMSGPQTKR